MLSQLPVSARVNVSYLARESAAVGLCYWWDQPTKELAPAYWSTEQLSRCDAFCLAAYHCRGLQYLLTVAQGLLSLAGAIQAHVSILGEA